MGSFYVCLEVAMFYLSRVTPMCEICREQISILQSVNGISLYHSATAKGSPEGVSYTDATNKVGHGQI